MPFDFKKEYKEFYLPKNTPSIVDVPAMNYIAVRGRGDPNDEAGEYKASIGLLYGIAFTVKMSKMGDHRMEGYFDFVVPPLEGFWRQGDAPDFSDTRLHHEIYLSDPRKCAPERLKTAIRHPVRAMGA